MGVRQMPFQKGTGGPQYAGLGIGGSGGGGSSYTLPTATASRLGGVKIGDNVDVTEDGTISVNLTEIDSQITSISDSVSDLSGAITRLESQIATTDTLGMVKVGSGLSITENGVLSASGGSSKVLEYETVGGSETYGSVLTRILNNITVSPDKVYLLFIGEERFISNRVAENFIQLGSFNCGASSFSTTGIQIASTPHYYICAYSTAPNYADIYNYTASGLTFKLYSI